jgi:hypothetical protein
VNDSTCNRYAKTCESDKESSLRPASLPQKLVQVLCDCFMYVDASRMCTCSLRWMGHAMPILRGMAGPARPVVYVLVRLTASACSPTSQRIEPMGEAALSTAATSGGWVGACAGWLINTHMHTHAQACIGCPLAPSAAHRGPDTPRAPTARHRSSRQHVCVCVCVCGCPAAGASWRRR